MLWHAGSQREHQQRQQATGGCQFATPQTQPCAMTASTTPPANRSSDVGHKQALVIALINFTVVGGLRQQGRITRAIGRSAPPCVTTSGWCGCFPETFSTVAMESKRCVQSPLTVFPDLRCDLEGALHIKLQPAGLRCPSGKAQPERKRKRRTNHSCYPPTIHRHPAPANSNAMHHAERPHPRLSKF